MIEPIDRDLSRISFNLNLRVVEKPKHHHQSLLDRFSEKLNADRGEGKKYPKLSIGRIAKMLEGFTYDEREEFYLECENVKWTSFPQYFHWKIKQKKEALKARLSKTVEKSVEK